MLVRMLSINSCRHHAWLVGTWDGQLLRKIVWEFLKKLVMHWQRDPAVTFLGFCPRWMLCSHLHTNSYSSFFVITNTWKISKCPSTCEWSNCGPSPPWNTTQHCKEMNYCGRGHRTHSRRSVLNWGEKTECVIWFISRSRNDKVV